MNKSPAQLDAEIADFLSKSTLGSASWDVAMDAILEHDPKRAAKIVQQIRDEHGVTASATPEFSKAVREAPADVRQKLFELLESPRKYSLPAFYEMKRLASDQRGLWFKALEEMKKPGYKGLQVVWYVGDRNPRKAKHSSIHDIDISQGYYKRVEQLALPPEVIARFEEAA